MPDGEMTVRTAKVILGVTQGIILASVLGIAGLLLAQGTEVAEIKVELKNLQASVSRVENQTYDRLGKVEDKLNDFISGSSKGSNNENH